jgi:RNA polymerase sigma-70 factor (ECF subfamily)
MATTRPSLLLRIRDPADSEAWQTFFAIYRPILLRYARAQGLGPSDADDVAQHALTVVHARIADFRYDPQHGRFKGWLRTIVNNHVRNLQRPPAAREELPAEDAVADERALSPDEVFDQLWMQEHLWHCLRELEVEVDEQSFAIFRRLVFDEAPVEAVCAEFGVERGNVYTIKWRLTRRIAERMRFLTAEDADGA